MWFLYLDESGDLGFDFVSKKPSKFFTITILALNGVENNRALINSVKNTLKRKLNVRKVAKENIRELKGSKISLEIKKYFYKKCSGTRFALFSMTLNKRRVYEELTKNKERVYNFIARKVLDQIPFEKATDRVLLTVDKSKSKPEIEEFNSYVIGQLQGRLNPSTFLSISHEISHENLCLQAADVFCWGIFRKYERRDKSWHDVYCKEKVKFDDLYLP